MKPLPTEKRRTREPIPPTVATMQVITSEGRSAVKFSNYTFAVTGVLKAKDLTPGTKVDVPPLSPDGDVTLYATYEIDDRKFGKHYVY